MARPFLVLRSHFTPLSPFTPLALMTQATSYSSNMRCPSRRSLYLLVLLLLLKLLTSSGLSSNNPLLRKPSPEHTIPSNIQLPPSLLLSSYPVYFLYSTVIIYNYLVCFKQHRRYKKNKEISLKVGTLLHCQKTVQH